MLKETTNITQYVVSDNDEIVGGLANAPAKRKVGFFSAIMIVIGGAIGVGIFLNNKQ